MTQRINLNGWLTTSEQGTETIADASVSWALHPRQAQESRDDRHRL
jgi:hypothetical protein